MQSRLILFAGSVLWPILGYAQPIRTDGGRHSDVRIAVPFLLITPDARAAGMGDAGAATPPGTHAMHWNAAKYAFAPRQAGIGLSFTPWLRQLTDDISLSHLSGYAKLGTRMQYGASEHFLPMNLRVGSAFTRYLGQAALPSPSTSTSCWCPPSRSATRMTILSGGRNPAARFSVR